MRSILLHAHDDGAFEARFQAALDLSRSFDAHLTILQPIMLDVAVPGDVYGSLATELAPIVRENAAEFREQIEIQLGTEDVRWDWAEGFGPDDGVLLQAAALSDLVIVGTNDPFSGKSPSGVAGALAVHAKAPILAVPEDCTGIAVDDPALVAWNGSAEASRALRAAVPFLARSRAVSLVTVGQGRAWSDNDEIDVPPVAGADYLARHGIEAEVVELPPAKGAEVAEVLREAARARGAGYLVMGAYGHSRMRETLLGGVTREMLAHPKVALFLAH